MASKGLGPQYRRTGSALAHGCGRSGIGALPLPRAAVISTRLRVLRVLLLRVLLHPLGVRAELGGRDHAVAVGVLGLGLGF